MKVGARLGGADAKPSYSTMPSPMAAAVTAMIPIITAPVILRKDRAQISTKPPKNNRLSATFTSPRPTRVAGLSITMPAFFSAMSARKKPMPAEMPKRRDMGMLLMIHSRTLKILSRKKIKPEMKTAPKATCQL